MGVPLVLVIASLSIITYWLFKNSFKKWDIEKLPGPVKFHIIGNMWFLAPGAEKRLSQLTTAQRNYGDRVYFTGVGVKIIMLFHPDDVEKVLMAKELMDKSRAYDVMLKDWMGSSLFVANGEVNQRMRKLVQPALDYKRASNFEENVNENAKILVRILKRKKAQGEVIEMQHLVKLFSLDTAFQYLAGVEMNTLDEHNVTYVDAVHDQLAYVTKRAFSPWLWPDFIWNLTPLSKKEKISRRILSDFVNKILNDRKKEILFSQIDGGSSLREPKDEYEGKEKFKILDLLIRLQQRGEPCVTDKYIMDDMHAVLFGAHDTPASTLSFVIYLLATHPEDQSKVQKEVDQVLGEDQGRHFKDTDLKKLKYLSCCIKETLRLYPSVPFLARQASQDCYMDEDLTIPKGTEVLIAPWVTHRLAEFFPEPYKFIPSRFLHENSAGRHPYAFFPFSAGSRNCMGQKIAMDKMKTVLAHIYSNFNVELAPGTEPMTVVGDIILYIKNGLEITLKSRKL